MSLSLKLATSCLISAAEDARAQPPATLRAERPPARARENHIRDRSLDRKRDLQPVVSCSHLMSLATREPGRVLSARTGLPAALLGLIQPSAAQRSNRWCTSPEARCARSRLTGFGARTQCMSPARAVCFNPARQDGRLSETVYLEL